MHPRLPVIFALFVIALTVLGCARSQAPQPLSASEAERLDSLGATEVVRTYFTSGDPDIEYYLYSSAGSANLTASDYIRDTERDRGVDALSIESSSAPFPWLDSAQEGEWAATLDFRVTYVSREANSIGEEPGVRSFDVRVGRRSSGEPWRIVAMMTPAGGP